MFAFNPFIGVLARSFNLFQKIFPETLTAPEAPPPTLHVSGTRTKPLAPRCIRSHPTRPRRIWAQTARTRSVSHSARWRLALHLLRVKLMDPETNPLCMDRRKTHGQLSRCRPRCSPEHSIGKSALLGSSASRTATAGDHHGTLHILVLRSAHLLPQRHAVAGARRCHAGVRRHPRVDGVRAFFPEI